MHKLPPVNDPAIKPWAREVEKLLVGNEGTLSGVRRSIAANTEQASATSALLLPVVQQVTQIPRAPQEVVAVADWVWSATGEPSATITVAWEEVLYDLNDGLVLEPTYEVWLRTESTPSRRVNSTKEAELDIPALAIGEDYYVKVRAISERGATGQFSGEAFVPTPSAAQLELMDTPSNPTVASSMGTVSVTWDGMSQAGTPLPPWFAYVVVAVSDTQNGTYLPMGQPLPRTGTAVLTELDVGTTPWIQLYAVDKLGRASDPTAPASVTVVGVELGTLGTDLETLKAQLDQNDIDVANATTGPVDGTRLVDGSVGGVKIADGSILAPQIGAGSVLTLHLGADSVDANAIRTHAVESDHVNAGAIKVVHLEAGIGGVLDISANKSVQFAVGQASDAQASAGANAEALAEMRTYYQFNADEAIISTPNSPFSLALQNDGIEIRQNGNVVSSWDAGQMHVDSFVGSEVILGNHKLEKYGSGTVVRAL